MSVYCLKYGDFTPTRSLWPKISGRRGRPTNHCFSPKTRLNDLSCGIKIWTDFSSVLSQCTHLTDGRTNRRTDRIVIARPRLHSMQPSKNQTQAPQIRPLWSENRMGHPYLSETRAILMSPKLYRKGNKGKWENTKWLAGISSVLHYTV